MSFVCLRHQDVRDRGHENLCMLLWRDLCNSGPAFLFTLNLPTRISVTSRIVARGGPAQYVRQAKIGQSRPTARVRTLTILITDVDRYHHGHPRGRPLHPSLHSRTNSSFLHVSASSRLSISSKAVSLLCPGMMMGAFQPRTFVA